MREPIQETACAVLASGVELGGLCRWLPGGTPHADLDWARSGAMALTGETAGPPLLAPAPLARAARAAVGALSALGGGAAIAALDGPALLGERAAVFGYGRRGAIAPGGSCRLLRARDGWLALNLARDDDRRLLPAWLGGGNVADAWRFAEAGVRQRALAELVERAGLLGLPAAEASAAPREMRPWCRVVALGTRAARAPRATPFVVDLSTLWAGPLCGHLLGLAGARVVKVESVSRLDGARSGPPGFFDLLQAGKSSVVLAFEDETERETLRRLVGAADVVIEGSRPRALRQLGIDAEGWLAEREGRSWVGVTGYGRAEPHANRVAFGDDAAAAAGLAVATGSPRAPLFCGDAIADPLAGLHAAVAALASFRAGGGHLIDIALCDGVAHWLAQTEGVREARVEACSTGFQVVLGNQRAAVLAPRARKPDGSSAAPGADTEAVLAELGIRC